MHNAAFRRAFHSLTHPLSIAAIILLLFNDHWLRWNYPSWLTGKLGDFTWLTFAPFIAALFFAAVIPRRLKRHETIVGVLAFGTIGVWFALAKTVPLFHALTTGAWETIIGWQGTLRMDSSDLLTLPALAVGWWVWQRTGNSRRIRQARTGHALSLRKDNARRPAAWVIFALGMFATLASDGPDYTYTDSGITQICQVGSQLISATETQPNIEYAQPNDPQYSSEPQVSTITTNFNVFTSDNGGLNWNQRIEANFVMPEGRCSDTKKTDAIDPRNPHIQYRWGVGEQIERSTDGGETWTLDRELIEMQQEARKHFNHYSNVDSWAMYSRLFVPGPVSGIVDADTRNLVLAMSWDGVLVRTIDGQWHWVTVGNNYKLANLRGFSRLIWILFYEWCLAGALILLVAATSMYFIRQRSIGIARKGLLAYGWLIWFVLMILLLPDDRPKADSFVLLLLLFSMCMCLGALFFGIVWDVVAAWDNLRDFLSAWKLIAVSALCNAFLFLLPFIPWTQGTIPRYTTALIFSLLLTWGGLSAAFYILRERLPVLEAKKKRNDTNVDTIVESTDFAQ
jgi:hypothetical protein